MPHRPGHFGAGFSAPRKAPTREEIEKTYDQALDRFIRQNQDKKQQQSSVKSVIADMPQKFQDFIARNTKDGRMNEAAKAIFRQYDDGRTQYSRDMGRMVAKSPEFAAARARRFPIETFLEKMAPVAVGAAMGIPLGLGTLYDESRKLGTAAIGGLKDIAEKKGIRFPNLFSNQNQELSRAENEQNMLDNTLATLNRQSEISATPEDVDIFANPQTDIAMAPDLSAVSAPAFERIFALPGDNLGKFTRTSLTDPTKASVTRGNYLVSDPGGFLRMATLPTGMAQGGIASLQDPNYNLLMEASDFSL